MHFDKGKVTSNTTRHVVIAIIHKTDVTYAILQIEIRVIRQSVFDVSTFSD